MSEEVKEATEAKENTEVKEEVKEVKKSWFNRAWAAILGLIVGVAGMFGIDQAQVSELKAQIKEATAVIQTAKTAIDNKDYLTAIGSLTKVIDVLKNITGEAKEAAEVVKESVEEYKADVAALKAAVDAKDYKTATEKANALLKKITEKVPAENLAGAPKQIYDLVVGVNQDIAGGKYEPIAERIKQLLAIFEKKAEVPATPETPAAN